VKVYTRFVEKYVRSGVDRAMPVLKVETSVTKKGGNFRLEFGCDEL